VRDPDGEAIHEWADLRPARIASRPAVALEAPAELLAERDYVILLRSGGAPDTIAHYIFRVHRRQSR
jgi:hypothetical protein